MIKNLKGKRFGKLLVEFSVGSFSGRIHWYCKCDCGKNTTTSTQNLVKGVCKSCGCLRKEMNKGDKNGQWKGDEVSYGALHAYIRNNLNKPEFCMDCKISSPFDVANISQKYKRELTDWEWLCRSCHMIKDGRYANMKRGIKIKI